MNKEAIDKSALAWMPKSVWGAIKWRELHARGLIDLPMDGEKKWFEDFVAGLPCPKCRHHFEEYVRLVPPDFSSRVAFFAWGIDAHNFVNAATKKRLMSMEEAYRLHRFLKDEEAP
jgi:Erv1 / Alr family